MTTANKLTILRMILTPLMFLALVIPGVAGGVICAVLFAVIALTDMLDGYIARHYDQVTELGKFLDPLADKALNIVALLILIELGRCPSWAVAVIVLREFIVTAMRSSLKGSGKKKDVAANIYGKLKTLLQDVMIVVMFIEKPLFDSLMVGYILLVPVVAITVFSGVIYALDYLPKKDV